VKAYFKAGLAVTGMLALFSFGRSAMLVREMLARDPVEAAAQRVRYHFALYIPKDRSSLFSELVAGVREGAAAGDASVSVHEYDASERELSMARYTGAEGVIVCPDLDDRTTSVRLEELRKAEIPVVLVNHNIASDRPWPFVGTNNYDLGKKAGAQIAHGEGDVTRLAVVYSEKSPAVFAERELFEMGISSSLGRSLSAPISVQRTDMNPRDAEKIVYQLLRETRTVNAIVFTSADDTLAGVQALIDLNLVGSVQVVGFGFDKTIRDYLQKGILAATLVTNPRATGRQAVASLVDLRSSGYTSNSVDTGIDVVVKADADLYAGPSRGGSK
jgi:ribose transport system substrate-binding protein